MAPFPHSPLIRHTSIRAHTRAVSRVSRAAWRIAIGLAALACALALGGLGVARAAPKARADTQPTLTVTIKSGTATQTVYAVAASGFPAQTAYTETFGDGGKVPPANGQTNASGAFTLWWTLDATSKYCGTISAQAGSASASTSFWVALNSDSQSGAACQGAATGGGSPTPANATPTTTGNGATPGATPAATQAPAPQPTVAPTGAGTASGTGLRALLGRIPWLWVGAGIVAAILLLIVALAMGSRKNKPPSGGNRPPGRRMEPPNRDPQWGASATSARRRAAQREVPPPGWEGRPLGQPPANPGGGWPQQEGSRSPHRVPGAGNVNPRWRIVDPDQRAPHPPSADQRWSRDQPESGVPDVRWSRSQPGARGNPPPRTLGDATSTRQRAARRDDRDQWGR
jgi:hypothetical protein